MVSFAPDNPGHYCRNNSSLANPPCCSRGKVGTGRLVIRKGDEELIDMGYEEAIHIWGEALECIMK